MNGKSLKVLTGLLAVMLVAAVPAAKAQSSQAQSKTRAQVIAEMQASRAAGTLYQPDYYPVFDGSWQTHHQGNSAAATHPNQDKHA